MPAMGAKSTAADASETRASRNTVQRALVLEAVRSLHNHPTSADVYEEVRQHHPSISRATVYRNLAVLAERGDVLRVEIPNGADRYDSMSRPHYHAKCRVCGRVFDIDMPYHDEIACEVTDAHGFSIEGHQITFTGVCADCQSRVQEQ